MLYWGISPPSSFLCSFGVQSYHTFSITTFRVAHFQLGVQSHYVFSVITFRVISLSLTFIAIVSAWLSEPPCLLVYDVQSHLSQLDIPSYQFSFGIQSRCFSLEFRVIVLVQHS